MSTVLRLNEITDVKVDRVSLVSHAANRAAFKIVKKGGNMLNLKTLFGHSEEPAATAILVKSERLDEYGESFESAGYKLADTVDGVCVLAKGDVSLDDMEVVKLSDDVAVASVEFKKMFDEWPQSTSFKDNLVATGFYPNLDTALRVLRDTIYYTVENAPVGENPADAVNGVLEEFSAYVAGLVAAIPAELFKAEEALEFLNSTEPMQDDGKEVEDLEKGDGVDSKPAANEVPDALSAVVESVQAMQNSIETLADEVKLVKEESAGFKDTLTAIKESVSEVDTRLEKAEESLNGVVPAEPEDEVLQKHEQAPKAVFGNVLHFDGLE